MCLGMSWGYSRQLASIASASSARPELTKLLAKLAESIPDEQLTFTGIQLNKDYQAAVHIDAKNISTSWIIGLGEYSGGELWVIDPGVTRKMKGHPAHQVGDIRANVFPYLFHFRSHLRRFEYADISSLPPGETSHSSFARPGCFTQIEGAL